MRFRWGDCTLDREARSLSRAGLRVAVQPLVLDLLFVLLQQRSRVVSEDVLRRTIWGDVHVTDAALRRLIKEARRSIGDDGEKQAQIRTVHSRGFMFVAPVAVEDGPDTSFVGRSDLLARLEDTLEAVVDGRGALTLLHGPAGIGKTRTLIELGARAEARGFRVLWGTGRAGAEGHAFHLWLDAAGELGIRELIERTAGAGLSGDGQLSAPLRDARFSEIARELARSAAATPLLLRLDDLQFADADSLALLRALAPSLRSTRTWIAGSIRTGAGKIEVRSRDLQALAADAATQVLGLRGLDTAELRALLEHQLRQEVSADSAERLCARSAGNPFFALQLAHLPSPEEWARAPEIGALIERRASLLSADARKLLRTAAALGVEFDPEVVREAEGCTPRVLSRALAEATDAGLLDPPGRSLRRFAHPLLAEALYAELASDERAAAAQHLRLGEALERLGRNEPFALARHFLAARSASGPSRALRHVRAAAEAAHRGVAPADADFWYGHAIALAEAAGEPARTIGDLLLGQAVVRLLASGLESARVPAERAAQIGLTEGERELLARAALEYAHRPFIVPLPRVTHWLQVARERPCGDPSLQARVSSRLGVELLLQGPVQAEAGRALLREGESAARALGDPSTLGRVLYDVNAASLPAADPRGWLARADEIVRCARQSHDDELEFRGLAACATAHMQLGERSAAEAVLERSRSFVREHGFVYARGVTRGIEAMFALLDGRFADARRSIDESSADAALRGSVGLIAQAVTQRFWLGIEEGRVGELIPLIEQTRLRLPGLLLAAAALALAHALEGLVEPALAALGSLLEALPSAPRDLGFVPALALAAEATFRVRAPTAAAALELELAPYAELNAVNQNAAVYWGSVHQALGWLAAARGSSAEAIRHFEAALLQHSALRSPPFCERSQRAIDEVKSLRRLRAV